MSRQVKPLPHLCGGRAHTLTVERVAGRWYAEALAFVREMLDELAGRQAA